MGVTAKQGEAAGGPPSAPKASTPLFLPENRSLDTSSGRISCIPQGGVWLITLTPKEASQPPISWRGLDTKQAGRLSSALLSTDLNLMIGCMRDIWEGKESIDEDYLARFRELKRRGLIRQTVVGNRVLPTPHGQALWEHAREIVAREILGEKRKPVRRPYYVVFDATNRPHAIKEWERAVAFAKRAVSEKPGSFDSIREPEDLVEVWEAESLPAEAVEKAELHGVALFDAV